MNGVLSLIRFDSSTSAIDGKQINRNHRINLFGDFRISANFHIFISLSKKKQWKNIVGITVHCFFLYKSGWISTSNIFKSHLKERKKRQFQLKSSLMCLLYREPLRWNWIFFLLLGFSSPTYYMGIKCDYLALEDPLESGIIYTFVWFEILCQETTIVECTRIVRSLFHLSLLPHVINSASVIYKIIHSACLQRSSNIAIHHLHV